MESYTERVFILLTAATPLHFMVTGVALAVAHIGILLMTQYA